MVAKSDLKSDAGESFVLDASKYENIAPGHAVALFFAGAKDRQKVRTMMPE